jgi:hypothetical protein
LNDAIQAAGAINSLVQAQRQARKTRGGPAGERLSEPDPSVGPTAGAVANTAWALMSMTATGQTEKQIETPSDVRFCNDGSWVIHHSDGSKQSGTYQLQADQLIMKSEDGTLFSDSKIKQTGNEMTLDDGKYALRLKYRGIIKC